MVKFIINYSVFVFQVTLEETIRPLTVWTESITRLRWIQAQA